MLDALHPNDTGVGGDTFAGKACISNVVEGAAVT
jgi:hypothetical protein